MEITEINLSKLNAAYVHLSNIAKNGKFESRMRLMEYAEEIQEVINLIREMRNAKTTV